MPGAYSDGSDNEEAEKLKLSRTSLRQNSRRRDKPLETYDHTSNFLNHEGEYKQ